MFLLKFVQKKEDISEILQRLSVAALKGMVVAILWEAFAMLYTIYIRPRL